MVLVSDMGVSMDYLVKYEQIDARSRNKVYQTEGMESSW